MVRVRLGQGTEGVSLIWSSGSGLDEIMTPEEKEKLYTAIGYSGSSHNLALPKQVRMMMVMSVNT